MLPTTCGLKQPGNANYLRIILRNKHFNTTNCRKRVINFQRYFSEIVILEHICKVVVKYVLIFNELTHDSESIIWRSVRTIQNHETQTPAENTKTTKSVSDYKYYKCSSRQNKTIKSQKSKNSDENVQQPAGVTRNKNDQKIQCNFKLFLGNFRTGFFTIATSTKPSPTWRAQK